MLPFFSTMGVELTWLYPKKRNENTWVNAYVHILRALFQEKHFKAFGVLSGVMNDGDALEIATPPFASFDELERYYSKLMDYIHQINSISRLLTGQNRDLVYDRKDTVSGGGHIHVAFPHRISRDPVRLLLFLTNLFRDIQNRPYLNWIFNDCGNVKSAENFVHMRDEFNRLPSYRGLEEGKPGPNNWKVSPFLKLMFQRDPKIPQSWTVDNVYRTFEVSKGYAIRCCSGFSALGIGSKPPTMEFRFLDAKRNLDEIRLHINFVNAYLRYIESRTEKGDLIRVRVRSVEDIKALGIKDQGLKQFKSFMEEVGLDYGNYRHFVKVNYRQRKKAGLLR